MSTPEEAAAIRAAELRISVAEAKGLPKGAARRLRGETRAELEADADELSSFIEPAEPAKPLSMSDQIRQFAGRPTRAQEAASGSEKPVSLDGGTRQSTKPPVDMSAAIREAAGR
jgi:hypothetical protein